MTVPSTVPRTVERRAGPMPTSERPSTVTVTVNGKRRRSPKGELVIDAAERHGVYIPRFCYHPRMNPVGMCRMCLVEIDTGRGPALQPACMIQVAPDMKVDTESAATKKAQDGVLEFLLINHPLDCPVCDKGGECPLQDQTLRVRPGRVALRRGEAALREADPDQRPRLPRPRALHPLRPLHPLRQRGGRRPADPLHQPRQPDRGQHLPRPPVRVVLQRQHRADLPGRRPAGRAVPLQGPARGTSTRSSRRARACAVGCRVDDRVEPQPASCATRASTSTRSTGAGCATRAGSTSRPSTSDERLSEPLVRNGPASS